MIDEDNRRTVKTERQDSPDIFVQAPGELVPRQRAPETQSSEGVLAEIWREFRPYLVKMSVDLFVSTGLWVLLFLFKTLQSSFAIQGWAADFITHIHSAGVVIAFGLFALLFGIDLYNIRKSGKME